MREAGKQRARHLDRKGDGYPVLLKPRLLDDVGALAKRLWPESRVVVVTQARVQRLHGERLHASLERAGVRSETLRIPEGEERKSLPTVAKLYDALVARRFTREDAIVAFGGGTVGDTAGFVAATYLRGIRYAQVPTTLLAQIDSSIGGKVGVNHVSGKNLIGAIYPPSAVWIDPDLPATLPAREFRSGLFELLKYGLLGQKRILGRFESTRLQPGSTALVDSIGDAVRAKLDVVRDDEREGGRRRLLNLGHTIGHGLEAAGEYRRLTHGEAVGWGMIGAIRLAEKLGRLRSSDASRLESAVRSVGNLPRLSFLSPKRTLDAVRRDKKMGNRGLRFVLPVGIGRVEIQEGMPLEEVAWAVASLGVGRRE